MSVGVWFTMFRRNVVPSSSWDKQTKKDDPLILEEVCITFGRKVISCPMMQSHIAEDLNRVCVKLKYRKRSVSGKKATTRCGI
jgi:hypothetical protein